MNLPPLIEEFKSVASSTRIQVEDIAWKTGVASITIKNWIAGKCDPRLHLFEATLNVLGHKLQIVPVEPVKPPVDPVHAEALKLCEMVVSDAVHEGGLVSNNSLRKAGELRFQISRSTGENNE